MTRLILLFITALSINTYAQQDQLNYQKDGRWLGPAWWGNRLQDWKLSDNKWICAPKQSFLAWRVAHDTTRNLNIEKGPFNLTVDLKVTPTGDKNKQVAPDALAGIILGAGHSIDYPMARLFMFGYGTSRGKNLSQSRAPAVPGSGYAIGLSGKGTLQILDLDTGATLAEAQQADFTKQTHLKILAEKQGDSVKITAQSGAAKATTTIPNQRFRGGLGLTSHPGTRGENVQTIQTEFSNYHVEGGYDYVASQAIGPIVCAQYTTHRGTLKLSAQCMPLPKETEITFEYKSEGQPWTLGGQKTLHEIDKNAVFRVENWNSNQPASYRLRTNIPGLKGATFEGIIAAEPKNEKLRLAVLGCIIHQPSRGSRNWNDTLYFPHHDLQKRVAEQKPDAVFFYGDQMYENVPSRVDRSNYHEDYLYKWIFHCMAFRETIRNVPSITIPDDHDAYQGNHWGASARKAPGGDPNMGGYRHPGTFVAQVHRTQTAHLPDAHEPDCLKQNIPAYHCGWNYAGVSFAIVGDRYFKSGPAGNGLPQSGTSRPDHYNNPSFDTKNLDLPGLQLLGEPQERFLAEWAEDWSHGTQMKAVLSQSPFGNLATHHKGSYLIADLDSNGWPQSGRKRALQPIRAARAVHIAGDQHLSTLVRHGIDDHDDAIYSFCAPAVSNAYARAYHPTHKENYYKTTPPKPEQYLGKRLDGFQNKVTFLAVANPDTRSDGPYTTKKQPELNQQVPGFGIVDFDTQNKTITFNSYPRSEIVAARLQGGQYPGWPVTIKASDNEGRKPTGELARVHIKGEAVGYHPVVKVYNPDGTLQSAERMTSNPFTVMAYDDGEHTVKVGSTTIKAKPTTKASTTTITVKK